MAVFWNTGFALYVAVGAVTMVGIVVVVAVAVVGATVVAIIVVIGPDGVPRLYVSCLYALHLHLACLSCHPPAHKKKRHSQQANVSGLYVVPSSRTPTRTNL